MVTSDLSPVGRAVLDDIESCAADLGKDTPLDTLQTVVERLVALSLKMNQLHDDGVLMERDYIPLNTLLLALGIYCMNHLALFRCSK